jgi:hypothetical protein
MADITFKRIVNSADSLEVLYMNKLIIFSWPRNVNTLIMRYLKR